MGELIDYYIIESVVDYDNDPLHIGRIKCTIPGVIHADTTPEEAMPWIRCFKMGAFQTFSRPIVGQKVWVLISKTNYNEFWWFPFFETNDLTQQFLDEHYDDHPDVFHSRHSGDGDAITTYDDKRGYMMTIGDDHINLKPTREFELDCNECRLCVTGNKIYIGSKDKSKKEPAVKGKQCAKMRGNIKTKIAQISEKSKHPYTAHLTVLFKELADLFTPDDILATYTEVD